MLKIQDNFTDNMISIETSFINAQQSYQAVAAICGAELKLKMFRNIKQTLHPMQSASVSRVDIPIDMVPYVENNDAQYLCINKQATQTQH